MLPPALMTDTPGIVDRLIARAGQLYSLPSVAMKVLELTDNPQVDTRALKACIENDPALTGKILRVVNSSLFGLSREVGDLNQALALLGIKPLKLLVLGFSLPDGLFTGMAGELLARYWRHTLTRAVAAREISQTALHMPGDDAFIVGLLQDLGMLLLMQEVGPPYVKLVERAQADGYDIGLLETKALGFDHTRLSARLLGHWGLPVVLVEAVAGAASDAEPDETTAPAAEKLGQVLRFAELFARLLAGDHAHVFPELLEMGSSSYGLDEATLAEMALRLQEKVEQLADVLSLQLPEGMDYRDILLRAHEQLAAVASETAGEMVRRQADDELESAVQAEVRELAAAMDTASWDRAVADAPEGAGHHEIQPEGAAPCGGTLTARQPSRLHCPPRGISPQATRDAPLLARLAQAVAACRQSRCPLSLVLIQLDYDDAVLVERGLGDIKALIARLDSLCRNMDDPLAMCVRRSEGGFALVLPNCERRLAVTIGNDLSRAMQCDMAGREASVRIGVGVASVALPPRNFPAEDLVTSADRCLYGSLASGGGVVKSIEIY